MKVKKGRTIVKNAVRSIRDLVSTQLVALPPETSIYDTARTMSESRVGSAVIIDDGELIGLVTDRDLVAEGIGRGISPAAPVSEVMTKGVVYVRSGETVDHAVRKMTLHGIRRIPVYETGYERLLGIVTVDDLILSEAVSPQALSELVHQQLLASEKLQQRRRCIENGEAGEEQRFLDALSAPLDVTEEQVEKLTVAAVTAITKRISVAAGVDLTSPLPRQLRESIPTPLQVGDISMDASEFVGEIAELCGLNKPRIRELLPEWWASLGEVLHQPAQSFKDRGKLADVLSQLPGDVEEVLVPKTQYHVA